MLTQPEFDYHLATLHEQDPDYIVDALDLTTEQLLAAFSNKAAVYLEQEYGDG